MEPQALISQGGGKGETDENRMIKQEKRLKGARWQRNNRDAEKTSKEPE